MCKWLYLSLSLCNRCNNSQIKLRIQLTLLNIILLSGLTYTKPINGFTSHLIITMECTLGTQCQITKRPIFILFFALFRFFLTHSRPLETILSYFQRWNWSCFTVCTICHTCATWIQMHKVIHNTILISMPQTHWLIKAYPLFSCETTVR